MGLPSMVSVTLTSAGTGALNSSTTARMRDEVGAAVAPAVMRVVRPEQGGAEIGERGVGDALQGEDGEGGGLGAGGALAVGAHDAVADDQVLGAVVGGLERGQDLGAQRVDLRALDGAAGEDRGGGVAVLDHAEVALERAGGRQGHADGALAAGGRGGGGADGAGRVGGGDQHALQRPAAAAAEGAVGTLRAGEVRRGALAEPLQHRRRRMGQRRLGEQRRALDVEGAAVADRALRRHDAEAAQRLRIGGVAERGEQPRGLAGQQQRVGVVGDAGARGAHAELGAQQRERAGVHQEPHAIGGRVGVARPLDRQRARRRQRAGCAWWIPACPPARPRSCAPPRRRRAAPPSA